MIQVTGTLNSPAQIVSSCFQSLPSPLSLSAYPRTCSAAAELILGLSVAKGPLFIGEGGWRESWVRVSTGECEPLNMQVRR